MVEGARLFSQGKFEAALRTFQAARAIYPSGRINYNIGLVYGRLGKPALALMAIQGFLRDPGDTTPELLAEARDIAEQLSRKVAFLTVSSNAPAVEVSIDDARVGGGGPPSRLPIEVGSHQVVLRSPGLGQSSRRFAAVAGQEVHLQIDLPDSGGTRSAVTGAAGTSPTRPSAAAQAESLIAEATSLRRAGKDARAYPLLQRAFEIEPTPRTEAQLGLVEIMLGYSLPAEKHLTEALAATRDAWIAGNRADLDESLARVRASIGELMVTGSPSGASVAVNDWVAGSLPLPGPIRLGEGPLRLEVRAPGYATFQRSLTITGGHREEVVASLERSAGSTPAASATGAVPEKASRDEAAAADATAAGAALRPLAWTASIASVLALGLGVQQSLAWREDVRRFESHVGPPTSIRQGGAVRTVSSCGFDDPNHGATGCDEIYRDVHRSKTLAVSGLAAGALLAAGAVTLFFLSPRERRTTQVPCATGPLFPSFGCHLTF